MHPHQEPLKNLSCHCLSEQIILEELWDTLGECLSELGRTSDSHAVLVLQPAVEAFFLVHGTEKQVLAPMFFFNLRGCSLVKNLKNNNN